MDEAETDCTHPIEQEHEDEGCHRRNLPGGDRTESFDRMQAVFTCVHQVIEDIDAAGEQAETGKQDCNVPQPVRVPYLLCKKHGKEQEDVFYPLGRAHQKK